MELTGCQNDRRLIRTETLRIDRFLITNAQRKTSALEQGFVSMLGHPFGTFIFVLEMGYAQAFRAMQYDNYEKSV